MEDSKWDVFISYASEDKLDVATPLAKLLKDAGVRVWLDNQELKVGDSLTRKIDEGLAKSRFGVVILSPAFFKKHWPGRELAGLRVREEEGKKVLLPVRHNVTKAGVSRYSPVLADALAVNTENGLLQVALALAEVVFDRSSESPSVKRPDVVQKLIAHLVGNASRDDLLNFLQFHLLRCDPYFAVGGHHVLRDLSVGDVRFDLVAVYVGHGILLTFNQLTSEYGDPFEYADPKQPHVSPMILEAFAKAQEAREWLAEKKTKAYRDITARALGRNFPQSEAWVEKLLEADDVRLEFRVFAGRRCYIDATPDAHECWGRLRSDPRATVKTYDFLVDFFRKNFQGKDEIAGTEPLVVAAKQSTATIIEAAQESRATPKAGEVRLLQSRRWSGFAFEAACRRVARWWRGRD